MMQKLTNAGVKKHNSQVEYTNKKLEKIAAGYPFPCKLVSRGEYDALRVAGAKYAVVSTLEKEVTTSLKKQNDKAAPGYGSSSWDHDIDYNYLGVIYDIQNNKYLVPSGRTANYEAGAIEIAVKAIIKKYKKE